MARVLHRPTPVPIASNGGCDTLFPLISGRYVRMSGDAPCSVLPSKIWRGLFLGHVWPVQILAGSGFGPPRGLGRAPTPTWATRQAQEGGKQFRHIFLEAVGTPGNLTVGELDAAHGGPGSRPLTSWTEAREGQLKYGLAPQVYEPKIEAAAIHECRTALRPLDATWAPTWAARTLHGHYTDVTRTWVPLVLNDTRRRQLAQVPPAPDSPLNGMLMDAFLDHRLGEAARASATLPVPPGSLRRRSSWRWSKHA